MNFLTLPGTLVFFCYFLVIFAFSLAKRKSLPGKTLYLFRALFPSWRFFEDFDEAPALYIRFSELTQNELGQWLKCLGRPRRLAIGLFYSPEANYVLAAGSLVQQLLSEIQDCTDTDSRAIESLVSYQLMKNLVRFHLPSEASRYQFKIAGVIEDLLISPVYEARSAEK